MTVLCSKIFFILPFDMMEFDRCINLSLSDYQSFESFLRLPSYYDNEPGNLDKIISLVPV
jgi:hypothetical protein